MHFREATCPYLHHDKCICEEVELWCCFECANGEAALRDHGEREVITG